MWTWMTYTNSFGHMVPGDLVDAVRADMDRQDPPGIPVDAKDMLPDKSALFIDRPGMVVMGRPNEIFQFLELQITIPSEDLADLIIRWTETSPVTSRGKTFYRFRSNGRCLVVHADRRDELLDMLRLRIDTAKDREIAFYASHETAQETLCSYNASMGIVLGYGSDKREKFRFS